MATHKPGMDLSGRIRFAYGGCFVHPVHQRHDIRSISTHELILVERGTLAMFEGDAQFQVGPGGFLHLRPRLRHGGLGDYPDDLRFTWLHFDHPGKVPGIASSGLLARPDIVADLSRRLLDEQDRPDAPQGSCDLLMTLILLECRAGRPRGERMDPNGLAERAQRCIALRHREAISTREVAEACSCHADHLGRVYRARFGRSIVDAIQAERIHSAKIMLRDGEQSIADIAGRCGFSDVHYFRRVFKRATGSSPRTWRSLRQRMQINVR